MRLQTSHNPRLSALSSRKESTFLGGIWAGLQAGLSTHVGPGPDYLASQQSQILSEDGNHRSGSRISAVDFPRVKCGFQRESSEALVHRTVPVPGGGAEGKDRNWPRRIWTH